MTRTLELTTVLDTDADTAWKHVQTSALLVYIARPLIRFVPKGKPSPKVWTPGEYRAWML